VKQENLALRIGIVFLLIAAVMSVSAQTTSSTYQGKLSDGSSPANGNFDFEFALYDAHMEMLLWPPTNGRGCQKGGTW
jgi:hypothetical protein